MGRQTLDLDEVRHGTITGYSWHQKHKEHGPPCQECKDAKSKASRDYNERKKREEADAEVRQKAWWRACSRLAERYPAEFRELLAEEMKHVPPIDQGESDEM